VRHAASLFPFLTERLALDELEAAKSTRRSRLSNPFDTRTGTPPLALDANALQQLVDASWSRRERWSSFQPIAGYADRYHPDNGRVPELLRQYVTQNALQPYVDSTIHDPRLWTQLGLVADHASFIDYIDRYAVAHPSTKASTELLFLLEKQAEASLDALITLIDSDPATVLQWTREKNPAAYQAIVTIRIYYARQLVHRGLTTRAALVAYFDAIRLSILATILRTTPQGYRASDAHFLAGAIDWRAGKRDQARQEWRQMTADPTATYAIVASGILGALGATSVQAQALEKARIDSILDAENGRWVSFSYDRLRKFGYHFDTF
jgi:hypothetical protein